MRGFLSTCFVMLVLMATSPSHAVCDDGTCLELQPGNNLVSFSSLPVDASISSVFGGLASSIVLIRSEGVIAHRLSNGSHAGNLVTIERNRGYWVTLDAPSAKTLPLSGESTDPDIRFNLHSGSNLISFPCAGHYLSRKPSLQSRLIRLKTSSARALSPRRSARIGWEAL